MDQVIVLDGGFATQLSRRVDEPVDGTPLWSASFLATDPQACLNTHLDFLQAGSCAITTNTYQASVSGFMKYLGVSENESIKLIQTAVSIAREACEKFLTEKNWSRGVSKPLVIGSVGPYGATLNNGSEYTGQYVESLSIDELIDWHRPRVKTLVESGVDLLAFETIPAQVEAEALVKLIKEFPNQKAWLSFSCRDGHYTSHGERFSEAVQKCIEHNPLQIVAVGTNCLNPKFVTPLFQSVCKINTLKNVPLVVYPNSGEVYDVRTGWSQGEDCKPLETYVPEWLDLGVQYIGGCCRTYPQDITKICEEVNKWMSSNQNKK